MFAHIIAKTRLVGTLMQKMRQ